MSLDLQAKTPHPQEKIFRGVQGLQSRPINEAVSDLEDTLQRVDRGMPTEEQRAKIAKLILELEVYGHGFLRKSIPVHHETDLTSTAVGIREALQDPLIELLSIISQEALKALGLEKNNDQ